MHSPAIERSIITHPHIPTAKPLCCGHRGAAGHAPENTLAAIEKGLALGASWIEIDVHCVEGELVVIHDHRLERTTNGSGLVSRRTLAYVRALDAGHGERVPLLSEVLELMGPQGSCLNIELKGRGTAAPVVAAVRQHIREHRWSYARTMISSFHHAQLDEVHRLDPHLRIAPLFSRNAHSVVARARKLKAWSINVPLSIVTQRLVDKAHTKDLRVLVWTVNDMQDIRRMIEMGVDGLITDYPERVVSCRPRHP